MKWIIEAHFILFEIILCFVVMIFMCAIAYCVFLKNGLHDYQFALHQKQKAALYLQQKENKLLLEKSIQQKLMHWKENHPHFYQIQKSIFLKQDGVQLLSNLLIKKGFSVISIQLNHHAVLFNMTGSFLQCYAAIAAINQLSFPININSLAIPKQNQLQMQFDMQVSHV